MMEAKIMIAQLLRRFHVDPVADFRLKIRSGVSLIADEVLVRFETLVGKGEAQK